MKILIDAGFYGLEHTGLGRYAMNLIDNLARIDKKNEYVLLLRKKYFNSLNTPINFKKVLADFKHYTLTEQIRLPMLIKRENPNIFHAVHTNVPFIYSGALIVTIHDLTQLDFDKKATTLPMPLYLLKTLAYNLVFKNSVIRASKIIVPSNFVRGELMRRFAIDSGKIEVIYEGVTTFGGISNLLNKYKIQKPYFVYVGNAYPHKNLETAIKALLFLNKGSNRKVSFLIVSSRGVFIKRLEQIINNLEANEFVKVIGFVPDSELASLLQDSVAFIYPSLVEGFGLQGLEAMAAGTLLLASDIPTFREIYASNAIFFDPNSVTSISNVLDRVLKMNVKKRKEIIKKAQKYIKKFSWETMTRETLEVYSKALKT